MRKSASRNEVGQSSSPRQQRRHSYSRPSRSKSLEPSEAFKEWKGQSPSPPHDREDVTPISPVEGRDSRLLHRLGYDAGDTGLDPRPKQKKDALPADFPAFIIVENEQPPNSPLSKALAESDWPAFHQHLQNLERLSQKDKLLFLAKGTSSGSSLLHTAVYKAPPALLQMLLENHDRNHETRALFLQQDNRGNTALHLWCANVEEPTIPIAKRLVLGAPQALSIPNQEGDTPLHMYISNTAAKSPKAVPVLQYMVDMSLDSTVCVARDKIGCTPLHVAIAHGAHSSVLEKLLEDAPQAASIPDERGMLPLHYSAAYMQNVTPKFVELLIKAFPDGLVYGSEYDDTPLHIMVSNCSKTIPHAASNLDPALEEIIELLMGNVRCNPLSSSNNENLNPLHCCALFDPPPIVASMLMKSPIAERAACMENDFGATPLHLAAAQLASNTDLVQILGTANAASTPDRLKRTPLHVASQNQKASTELIEVLVKLNPEAASVETQRGHLPLHLAAQSQAKPHVVAALLKANAAAAKAESKSKNTPLHDAAKYKASAEVVRLLLQAYPDGAFIQNKHGHLPLHCATAYHAPPEVCLLLLKAWPDGAAMQNKAQDAPLHYVASHYFDEPELLQEFIQAAPAAVLLLNSKGESPMDRAKANRAPPNIIHILEQAMAEWTNRASQDPGFGLYSEDFDGESM